MPRQRRTGSRQRTTGPSARKSRGILQDLDEGQAVRADLEEQVREVDPGWAGERRPGAEPRAPHEPGRTEFELLRGLSCAISAELDLGRLARAILDHARAILGAERGILFLGGVDAAGLVPVLALDVYGNELEEIGKVSRTVLARARGGELVVTGNAPADPRFAGVTSVRLNQMRSIICGPLVAGSGPVGALYLDATRAHAFQERAVEFFSAMAGIAAVALENARLHGELAWENTELRTQRVPVLASPFDRIVGTAEPMRTLLRQAQVAARLDDPLFIMGEAGSGRRRLARVIHDASRRAAQPFVECDGAALPAGILRGALWGRTGVATKAHPHGEPGIFRQAEPGSLFLSGIQGAAPEFCAAVVRFGETGAFRPMGSQRDERASVRLFLAADATDFGAISSRRRSGLERTGRWFRLTIPPLRERLEDIPTLAVQFMREATGAVVESAAVPLYTPDAFAELSRHSWPGNLRELRHAVRRMLLISPRFPVTETVVREVLAGCDAGSAEEVGPWTGEIRPLREWVEEAFRRALLRANGNKVAAARLLGVHRNTVVSKTRGWAKIRRR